MIKEIVLRKLDRKSIILQIMHDEIPVPLTFRCLNVGFELNGTNLVSSGELIKHIDPLANIGQYAWTSSVDHVNPAHHSSAGAPPLPPPSLCDLPTCAYPLVGCFPETALIPWPPFHCSPVLE